MIYLVKSKDIYHIDKKIKEIINKYTIEEFDIHRYDAKDKNFNYGDVVEDLRTIPFLSEFKLVIINNPNFLFNIKADDENVNNEHTNAIIEYINNPAYESILFMYSIDYNFKTSKEFKNIIKNIEVIDYSKFNSNNFIDDARSLINQANLKLDNQAFNLLIKNSNNDYSILISNIEKLVLYNDKIDINVIKALSDAYVEDNIFEFTNAIFDKNITLTFKILDDFYNNNLSTFYLIAILASQLRFYNQVSYYYHEHYSIADIMHLTNSKKEYRITLALNTLNRYQNIDMLEMLNKLAILEQALKTNDNIDERLRFELFILELIGGYDYAIN